jgi:hypothetical protein
MEINIHFVLRKWYDLFRIVPIIKHVFFSIRTFFSIFYCNLLGFYASIIQGQYRHFLITLGKLYIRLVVDCILAISVSMSVCVKCAMRLFTFHDNYLKVSNTSNLK